MKTRRLKVDLFKIPKSYYDKVIQKYSNLTVPQLECITDKLGLSILFCYLEDLIQEDENVRVIVTSHGEFVMRLEAMKYRGQICISGKSISEAVGVDEEEIDNFARQKLYLEPDEFFRHPLMEKSVDKEGEEYINDYGVASVLINCIRNVNGIAGDSTEVPEERLKYIVFIADPQVNMERLIAEIKTHNHGSMLKATTLMVEGIRKLLQD